MCATRAVLVLLFAVIACAVAIPAAVPQPETPIGARAAVGVEQRVPLEKRQIEAAAGPEGAEDLKGSSSFGYGYYGGYPGYGYGGYGRPWGWGGYPYYGYGYPYGYYRPYYRPYGGYYGYW